MLEILYEDNHLMVVNKKSGILVQSDSTNDTTIVDQAKAYIKIRDKKPGNVFLGLPHRLDRPTSGILVLCKTSKSLQRVTKIFKERKLSKIYWAIVENKPPKNRDKLVHFLKKNQKTNKVSVHQNQIEGSKEAILEYKLLKNLDYYFLLEIQLHTGRTHQIRAQLSKIGCSIKGDLKYGAKRPNANKSIDLLAREIRFKHPVKQTDVLILAPTPNNAIWQACLD